MQKAAKRKDVHELSYKQKVAEAAGCSERMAGMVLNGERSNKTELGKRIMKAARLIALKEGKLVEAVKKAVGF